MLDLIYFGQLNWQYLKPLPSIIIPIVQIMKTIKSKLLITFFLLFAQSAFAAENFMGMKGNAYVGLDLLTTRIDHRYTAVHNIFGSPSTYKRSNDGLGYGINAGYKISKNDFFIAPELFYERLDTKSPDFYNSSAQYGDKLRIRGRYGVKLNLGYNITDKISAFVNYGYASVGYRQEFRSVDRFYGQTKSGALYGFGFAYKLNNNFDIRLAYDIQQIKTNYDIAADTGGGIASGQADSIKIKTYKVGLAYNF